MMRNALAARPLRVPYLLCTYPAMIYAASLGGTQVEELVQDSAVISLAPARYTLARGPGQRTEETQTSGRDDSGQVCFD